MTAKQKTVALCAKLGIEIEVDNQGFINLIAPEGCHYRYTETTSLCISPKSETTRPNWKKALSRLNDALPLREWLQ